MGSKSKEASEFCLFLSNNHFFILLNCNADQCCWPSAILHDFNGSFWSFTIKCNICYRFSEGTNYQVTEISGISLLRSLFCSLVKWLMVLSTILWGSMFQKGRGVYFIYHHITSVWHIIGAQKKLLNKWQKHWYHLPIQTLSTAVQCWQHSLSVWSPNCPIRITQGSLLK